MSLHPDFLNELGRNFSGDLKLDAASRALFSTDASMYQIEPLGVAFPKNQDDLQSAVELAARYKIPILARGAGTSLGGQAIGEALILDCSRYLTSIVKIDSDSHTAEVEPGVVLSNLNRAASAFGLKFGPDPASAERATLGGVIGNNSTGAHSILYGMTADHLLAADVLRADGSRETWDARGITSLAPVIDEIRKVHSRAIERDFPRSWRNSAGYRLNYLLPWTPAAPPQWDSANYGMPSSIYEEPRGVNIASLLAGSEGTLAILRRATVNLVPRPAHTILGVLAYASNADACDDVQRLLAYNPSAIELIPREILQLARRVPAYARQMAWVVGDPAAVLVVEFGGDDARALKDSVRKIGELLAMAETAEEQARIWNIRRVGLGLLDSNRSGARPIAFIEDCAIPVEHLGEFMREVERILAESKVTAGVYAHASAGCLHIRPVLDLRTLHGIHSMRAIAERVLELTLRLGGSMSSEHGDGIVRGEWLKRIYGEQVFDAMRKLKRAADPDGILNPRKMLDARPMDTQLRVQADADLVPWQPAFSFDHELGLAGSIAQCNGQGVCRKETGLMCPSFQATRDEAYSTRGRANLLRALMRGASSVVQAELREAAHESLELCLACKGCTSECPSGVDMPQLKYEFMNQYYKSQRRPLRDYLFANFHLVAAMIRRFGPLANAVTRSAWSRGLLSEALGLARERSLPQVSTSSLATPTKPSMPTHGRVIWISDVFSRYLEPSVEQAGFDVLAALGFEVITLKSIGAGAAYLSKGFIEQARLHANTVLDEITSIDPSGESFVVGCEPPEIYCLKHEYLRLLHDRRADVESVSQRTMLLDEFLVRQSAIRELRVGTSKQAARLVETQKRILFHPHCHQRAEGPADDTLPNGTEASITLLKSCGFEVELSPAGCCGMAGTFGFEAEHYALSMKIGELSVLPHARQAELVCATGAACRMHIEHATGKHVVPPLVLIADFIRASRVRAAA